MCLQGNLLKYRFIFGGSGFGPQNVSNELPMLRMPVLLARGSGCREWNTLVSGLSHTAAAAAQYLSRQSRPLFPICHLCPGSPALLSLFSSIFLDGSNISILFSLFFLFLINKGSPISTPSPSPLPRTPTSTPVHAKQGTAGSVISNPYVIMDKPGQVIGAATPTTGVCLIGTDAIQKI